jgi:hypothetical protein
MGVELRRRSINVSLVNHVAGSLYINRCSCALAMASDFLFT